jgi:hypothetical protein
METINTNSYYSLNNIDNYKSTINDNSSEIINKYFLLINEYLSFIIENISFKNSVYTKFTVERGFETITHVFTLLLYFSRNLDLAYYHGQKSFYFYVEFIGQISEDKHSFLQLNSRDASMFVYKKTIFDMFDGETNNDSNTMSNIMTLNDDNIIIDENEWQIILSKLSKLTNILFHWENTSIDFDKRINICNLYVSRFLIRIDQMFSTIEYLEIIQKKINLNYEKYDELLKEILERKERIKRERSETFSTEFDKNENFLIKFCLEENILQQKFNNGIMKEFVTWLYSN